LRAANRRLAAGFIWWRQPGGGWRKAFGSSNMKTGLKIRLVHWLVVSLCLGVLLLSGVMLWPEPQDAALAIRFVAFTNPLGQPRSAVFGVTNLSHRTIALRALGQQVRSNGVWSEIMIVGPLPMSNGLGGGQGTKVTVAVPTGGEAWRMPLVWVYRPSRMDCYVARGKNLLDTARRGTLSGSNYGFSMTGHTNFSADMESTKAEPSQSADPARP